ncbi:hypothetical protein IB286_09360 [Spongiibacter sp. KMU-158]|uniref:Uncharacterized protein n=1 Tax=Spongiibacter pelagi TaxID=2760804 RepID=A0A927C0X4_9GAMM|nr:hypothetical protein [Spongiibacter pelagi]MBD2859213.1 hypothetical protein [Spongiibacter pelagi]
MIFKTWLLNGLFHSAPGYLSIEGDEISFTLIDTGTFGRKKLDLVVGKKGAFEQISEGREFEVFRTQRSGANFHSPWYMFMGGGVLTLGNGTHKLSFMQPQNTKFPYQRLGIIRESDITDFKDGRELGKRFNAFINNKNSPW